MINTAYIERLNATFRERLAPMARRCRALARHTLTLHEGMFVVGTVYNLCTPHESLSRAQQMTRDMAAGITDHCWNMYELLSFHVPLFLGHHPSNVGVPHRHSNASSSDGAGTTVSCGATHLASAPLISRITRTPGREVAVLHRSVFSQLCSTLSGL